MTTLRSQSRSDRLRLVRWYLRQADGARNAGAAREFVNNASFFLNWTPRRAWAQCGVAVTRAPS